MINVLSVNYVPSCATRLLFDVTCLKTRADVQSHAEQTANAFPENWRGENGESACSWRCCRRSLIGVKPWNSVRLSHGNASATLNDCVHGSGSVRAQVVTNRKVNKFMLQLAHTSDFDWKWIREPSFCGTQCTSTTDIEVDMVGPIVGFFLRRRGYACIAYFVSQLSNRFQKGTNCSVLCGLPHVF